MKRLEKIACLLLAAAFGVGAVTKSLEQKIE
jgi:hypothetical protein